MILFGAASISNVVRAWNIQPPVALSLVLPAVLYPEGVRRIRRRGARSGWKTSRTACFLGGIAVLAIALVSPIDAYADSLLSVHMVQHLLLMQVAPPLLLLGRPITLALRASSGAARARVSVFAHSGIARALGSPAVGFSAFAIVLWVSHFSPLYEATLTEGWLHALEHMVFLLAALLFWWPVVARDPGAARLSHPGRLLYLFLSMPVMSLLGFVVSSSNHVLYPHYVVTSGLLSVSGLADQRLGGTIMWESSMLVSVVALSAVLVDWMHREEQEALREDLRGDRRGSGRRPVLTEMKVDAEGR